MRRTNTNNDNSRRSNTATQRLLSNAYRRRRTSAPARDRVSTASQPAAVSAPRVSSSNPNAALLTPSGVQRAGVRGVLLANDFNLASLVAPDLSTPDNSNRSSRTTNNASSSSAVTNAVNISSVSGNNRWLGNVASALTRSPRRTMSNDLNSNNHPSPNNNGAAANANDIPTTPTLLQRRRMVFRQRSLGSFFSGLDSSTTGINYASSSVMSGRRTVADNANNRRDNTNGKAKDPKVRKHHILQVSRRLQQQHSKRYPYANVLGILEFLRTGCPTEVTLKILAFLGPKVILQLQRTQRSMHHLLQREVSWRVLCEELYKWRPGEREPNSWKEHYRVNPCVPADFSSVGLAMAVVGAGWTEKQYKRYIKSGASPTHCPEIRTNLTIWLRTDETHVLQHAITVSTLRRSTQITIRTMYTLEFPKSADSIASLMVEQDGARNHPEECHPDSAGGETYTNGTGEDADEVDDDNSSESDCGDETTDNVVKRKTITTQRTRALLQSKTRRRNEPLIRVLRGQLFLQQVELEHSCLGTDIWNGNAAIQIQPSYLHSSGSILALIPSASAVVQDSAVQSLSGRGIVTVDCGQLICEGSYVHNCAATGVYVGGRGSCATLTKCDIWYNGSGNPHLAGGIARGHSGVYVEQSKMIELRHCSVAYNTASGISMIGNPSLMQPPNLDPLGMDNNLSRNIGLCMTDSDVLSNGCSPIDLPHTAFMGGELLSQQNFPWQLPDRKNRIAVVGVPQARSIPLLEELSRKNRNARQAKSKRSQLATTQPHERQRSHSPLSRNLSWNGGAPWNL